MFYSFTRFALSNILASTGMPTLTTPPRMRRVMCKAEPHLMRYSTEIKNRGVRAICAECRVVTRTLVACLMRTVVVCTM